MTEELYVKFWFFLVVVCILIATSTGVVIYYGEAQQTQNLINDLTHDFESKLVTLQTNQSIALSQLANDFATLTATSTAKIEEQATIIGQLSTEKQSLQTLYDTLLANYNTLQTGQQTFKDALNNSWLNYTKKYNDALNQLDEATYYLHEGNKSFTIAYNSFRLNTSENHTRCKENATTSKNNYKKAFDKFNTTSTSFNVSLSCVMDEWSTTLLTHYVALNRLALNVSQDMKIVCGWLYNTSDLYDDAVANDDGTEFNSAQQQMNAYWQQYNASYNSYIKQKYTINNYFNM